MYFCSLSSFRSFRLAVWLLLICAPLVAAKELPMRVGVYLNPPLSIPATKEKGASGFIIDLLDYIAGQEGWRLTYVSCTWDQCNQLLKQGEIDMLAPIAANDAEERKYDINRESLYVNWGQIVSKKGEILESPLDLAGKSVIALSGDIHFNDLKQLAHRFDIDVRFFEVNSYEEVLAWVAEGPVDAGLINRTLDLSRFPAYKLEKSSIIFNPAEIRIAFSPHNDQLQNALRIQSLDYQLAGLKGNRNSIYYQLQKRWFGSGKTAELPTWVLWTLLAFVLIALLLSAGVLLLRRQVHHQTHHIRRISDRFSAFMDNLPGIAYMKDVDGRYLFVNPVWEQTKHLSSAQVVGRLPVEIWPTHDVGTHVAEERQAIERGETVETIETSPWDDLSRYWRVIRFPIVEQASDSDKVMVGGIGLDITAQRDAEARHAQLNRQLQLLLESVGGGIFGLDGVGRCSFINQEALDLLGYRRDELVNCNLHDLIHHSRIDGSQYPESESPIQQAIVEGRRFQVQDEVFWRADGSALAVEYTVHPIAGGEFPGAVVLFHRRSE